MKQWSFVKSGPDGDCNLFGVNIFDYEWENTGENATVKDPAYHQEHTFPVWRMNINGVARTFAAGEFSNCVWGFYI